jgi:Primase X
MEISDISDILRLFEGSLFPRTISTFATHGKQISVNNVDDIFQRFKESDFVDCRINAYPAISKIPDFVMADLDLSKFRTERLLIKALDKTVDNIRIDLPGSIPMILFTGGGYHVYQPIDMPVLEEESMFRFFDNPSTEFIRYAAQKWTDGKNDTCNNPSLKSCLLRVPGSINSKNLKTVEIVQDWNGKRPRANILLQDFYIKCAARMLAVQSTRKELYFYPTTYLKKTYRHYGHMPTYPAGPTAYEGIAWIDSILTNGGIPDYRKLLVDLVLAPYLVNIKQCDYNDAYNRIVSWLNRCSQKRRLDFNARYRVKCALSKSKQNGIKPMRLDTMQTNYLDVYQEVVTSH